MKTPFDPSIWRQLETIGAASLRPGFADRVLRASRLADSSREEPHWLSSRLMLSAATAAVCFGLALFVRAQEVRTSHALYSADWQEISAQTANLDPSP